MAGISTIKQIRESSFDIRATSRLNRLYIELLQTNPEWGTPARRHDMNHFMARLIFCFFAGRLLAKRALEELGSFYTDVLVGTHREPLWPSGFAGSISHSQNIIYVLILKNNNLLIGMDIEHRITSEQCESLVLLSIDNL